MGEMPSMAEIHPKNRVTRLKKGKKHSEVRLSAAVGLNIRPCRFEELLGSCDGQLFDGIHVLAAAVKTLVG